jgi:hypothetical protein
MFAEFLRSRCPDYRVEYARRLSEHLPRNTERAWASPYFRYSIEGREKTLTADVPDHALAKLRFADMWSALEPLFREEHNPSHVLVMAQGGEVRVVRLER